MSLTKILCQFYFDDFVAYSLLTGIAGEWNKITLFFIHITTRLHHVTVNTETDITIRRGKH